ncbi:hypothetical protein C5B73_01320 [Nocardia cyriacigeorgica]|nr:hypothetical protein C5B73_01320 [Nocardia cyriacigeorgica]
MLHPARGPRGSRPCDPSHPQCGCGLPGVSVFEVLDIDGEHALVQSVQEAPGKYPFRTIASYLVPAEEP